MPLKIMEAYLQDLGGVPVEPGMVTGPGWKAYLERIEDFQLGSIRVGQVRFILEGEKGAIQALLPLLEQKMMRAGA